MRSYKLLTEGEVFEIEILSRTDGRDNPAQKMPEGRGYDKNLIGTFPIELEVKLLILRVFDLLANTAYRGQSATDLSGMELREPAASSLR